MHSKIASPISSALLKKDIDKLLDQPLAQTKSFVAYSAYAIEIPNIMLELGRLREITFREVGEGTGMERDLDEFDEYCQHIFIWDEKENNIVGAYRLLSGAETIEKRGLSGFYLNTLFSFKPQMEPILRQSLELGRSFIVEQYQRKPRALMLLWKALTYSVIKTHARYLIGPVSISAFHGEQAIATILYFLRKNYYNQEVSPWVESKNPFLFQNILKFDKEAFDREVGSDFGKLDQYLLQHFGDRTPILIRQYVSLLKTQAIAFNVDKDFNNCVDALMLMDLSKAPQKTIESLLKDQKNPSEIYARLKNIESRMLV